MQVFKIAQKNALPLFHICNRLDLLGKGQNGEGSVSVLL